MFKKKVKLVTHNSKFHADDVFATALLIIWHDQVKNQKVKVIRTRDQEIIDSGDIVYDVGMVYDHERRRYDHHMKEGAGERNGIKYSAFGLIWKHYGRDLTLNQEVWKDIDEKFVQQVCAGDTASLSFKLKDKDWEAWIFDDIVGMYIPFDSSEKEVYKEFMKVVSVAKSILLKFIDKYNQKYEDKVVIEKIYEETEDKRIIILDKLRSWRDVLSQKEDAIYLIYETLNNDSYHVMSVNLPGEQFKNKKPFPEAWRGLKDGELQEVSGIRTAVFCHSSGFMAVTKNLEDAILLAKKSLDL